MTRQYEIVPGESIGPFKLGMTREEIEGLSVRPTPPRGAPSPGVVVLYDGEDRCRKILAYLSYDASPPIFTLFGKAVNGITDDEFAALLRTNVGDVQSSYASVGSESAGIRAAKWERTDEQIMCIAVIPKTYLVVYGFRATDIHRLADSLAQVLDAPLYQKQSPKKGLWYTSRHVQATLRALRQGRKMYQPQPIFELVPNAPGPGNQDAAYLGGDDYLLRVRASARDLDGIEQALRGSGLEFSPLISRFTSC